MFIQLAFGGVIIGFIGGILIKNWLNITFNDYVLEINLTIIFSYLIFYIAESCGCSGILALVTLGLHMSKSGKTGISHESEHAVHYIWGYVGYVAETCIFLFAGLIMGTMLRKDKYLHFDDWMLACLAFILLSIIRYFCLLLFLPILQRMGFGMTMKELCLVGYSGLRGAVGLCLALMVKGNDKINHRV